MELWLIRHALPLRIDGGDGPADPGLAPDGVDQAAALAAWWGRHGVDAVWASPMRRAQETAQPLADVAGLDVEVHPGLAEYDAHLPTYVPLEELRADEEAWAAAVAEWMSPEAEERRQAFRRTVVEAVESIAARHAGQRVAVVCHGGVINAYLSHVLSMASTMWFEPAYTSVSRALVGDRTQVVSVNEAPHLPGLLLPSTAR